MMEPMDPTHPRRRPYVLPLRQRRPLAQAVRRSVGRRWLVGLVSLRLSVAGTNWRRNVVQPPRVIPASSPEQHPMEVPSEQSYSAETWVPSISRQDPGGRKENKATFVASRRGSPKLCFEGYMYTKHRNNDEKTAWRCEKFEEGCRGRAVTAGETTTVTQGHTCHLPTPENAAAARLQDKIKTAAKRSHDTRRNVVAACLQGARPATITKLPKLSSQERKVNRVRREAHGAAQVPHRIEDIIVPEHLRMTRTASPEVFLAGDTGCIDSERIMIFDCNTDLCRLNTCETWLCDGTFKVAPEMFYQLWVVHGLYKGRVLPLVYCLLPNKREATYKRATRMLLEAIDDATSSPRQVHTVVMDFEKAEENSFRECIPDDEVHGCLFHFAQSIWRRIQELGMHTRFVVDSSYHLILKKFIALCFCNVFDVCDKYRMLARQLLDLFGRTEQHQES
ncbi:hypothetical protein HPB47_024307 [Ixodes persulcatus]|uniref:Uncharacterized protein n=1 Tax=Ixodes persulcatus TaxID=34615 RepID=A0AC60Q573_IXOPE|nr:hypothetical protein HPB47_024307 [Ixodes persulcatus]